MRFSFRHKGLLILLLAALAGGLYALLEQRQAFSPQPSSPFAAPPAGKEGAGKKQAVLPDLPLSPHFASHPDGQTRYRELRDAAERRPDEPLPKNRLAAFLHEAGEPLAAQRVLDEVLRRNPQNEVALGLAAVTEMQLGHLDLAQELLHRLVERAPGSWNAWHHLGLVQARLRRFTEAESSFTEAAKRDPAVFWPHVSLGLLRLRQGRPQEALAELDQAARLDPGYPGIEPFRMRAFTELEDTARADAAYREYLKRHTTGTSEAPFSSRPPLAPLENADAGGLHFTDVAPGLKLDVPGRGRGAAFADFDGDGHLDLLVGFLEEAAMLFLSRDRGASYVEAATQLGLGFFDNAAGLTVADLDNDGRLDLYVTRGGFQIGRRGRDANLLLHGRAGGRFEDVTVRAVAGDPGMGLGTVAADFDRDGLLDLFVVNHGDRCRLLRNAGDGTFADVSERAGVSGVHRSVSAVAADFDDDGDPDLFVAVNGEENLLYRNDTPERGEIRFAEVGFDARVALSGGFGSTVADFDNDGRLDLLVANMNNWDGGDRFDPGDPSYLFLNKGGMKFAETALAAGLSYVGGATAPVAADLDADGWVDIYLGTGGPEPRRREPDVLYRNLGVQPGRGLRFAEVTRAAGVLRPTLSGRGVTVGDHDADGDLDLYVPNGTHLESELGRGVLWRNDTPQGHRVMLRLVGTRCNRSAIGARAVLRSGDLLRTEEVSGNTGWGGQRSLDLFFGLGSRTRVDSLTIRWPSGEQTELGPVPVDRLLVVTEGERGFEER